MGLLQLSPEGSADGVPSHHDPPAHRAKEEGPWAVEVTSPFSLPKS